MNVIGFDDGPFARERRGKVLLVGAVCASTRLDGVVSGHVLRDGSDATSRMLQLVQGSAFRQHVRAVLLQGIAVGGFNVVDLQLMAAELGLPVLVIMRRPPDLAAVHRALFSRDPPQRPVVRGAKRKWQLIEAAGPIERLDVRASRSSGLARGAAHRLWIQRAGVSLEQAGRIVAATTLHGQLPEPLRLAHLIAGGIATGHSRGRA